MTYRYDNESIEYTDEDALKAALIGRSIKDTFSTGHGYSEVITFVLDDGTHLKAHAQDGGCACSNGCFDVTAVDSIKGTILNVEVAEFANVWDRDSREYRDGEIEPGSISDGSSTIRIFVYTDLIGKATLVESTGGDNGYYGWGFWLSVEPHWNGKITL